MPNNVTNTVRITGPSEDLHAILELMKGEDGHSFDFEQIAPMPKDFEGIITGCCTIDGNRVDKWRVVNGKSVPVSEKEMEELSAKHGATNWYDWAYANWGTKWNSYDLQVAELKGKTLKYVFDTAWDLAHGVYQTLSKKFPNVTIKIRASGEIDTPYTATYKNGEGT
jgi:hypothetical protein